MILDDGREFTGVDILSLIHSCKKCGTPEEMTERIFKDYGLSDNDFEEILGIIKSALRIREKIKSDKY